MADKRMFSSKIVSSDAFTSMPTSAQALYFQYGMQADDDGFVNNPLLICRGIGASIDDLNTLLDSKFILTDDSGVIVIKHWKINNTIRKDTYHQTNYKEFLSKLFLDENGSYTFTRNEKYESALRETRYPVTENQNLVTENPISRNADKNRLDKNSKEKIYKKEKPGSGFKNFNQRDYDNEDLEKEIVENL